MTLKALIDGVWTKVPIYAVIDAIHTRFSSEKYEAENVSDALEEVADDVIELKSDITQKISDAPIDGKQYARQNGAWFEVEGAGVPLDADSTIDFALGYDEGGLYTITEDDDDE